MATNSLNHKDFYNSTKNYGNDVVSLIKTYRKEILAIDANSRSQITSAQLTAIFIAYAMALNITVFRSFKDESIGRLMLKEYQNEFEELFESNDHADGVMELIKNFTQKLAADAKNISQYGLDIYFSCTFNQAKTEELTWVKNYLRAIHVIYIKYNQAAEKHGFF